MIDWILLNWQGLLGGGSVTTIATYLINRKSNKADFVTKMQNIYDKWVEDADKKQTDLRTDITSLKAEIKEMRSHERDLQSQFNEIQLAYAKEVERSQNWEKLHRELTAKYAVLERDYDELKGLYEKLKSDFEKHKKLKQ